MLSYPVSRFEVVCGKFIGGSFIISFATLTGYGSAGLLIAVTQESMPSMENWLGLVKLIGSASLLGAAFIGLGLACSSLTSQRGAAAGLAVSTWLLFVIIFDLALLGGLVAGFDEILSEDIFPFLLLLNPADAFRILNMEAVSGTGLVSGMAEVASSAAISAPALWGSLILWTLVPLSCAILSFRKKDI
jgi:Cu-processing system permease protein